MIVPMKKYGFLIHSKGFENFLSDLQEIGVVDIKVKKEDWQSKVKEELLKLKHLKSVIQTCVTSSKQFAISTIDAENKATECLETIRKIEVQIEKELDFNGAITQEINKRKPFGEFSSEYIDKLNAKGVSTRFFRIPKKHFKKEWTTFFNLFIAQEFEEYIYFILFDQADQEVDLFAEEISLSLEHSSAELEARLNKTKKEVSRLEKSLEEVKASALPHLLEYEQELKKRINQSFGFSNAEEMLNGKVMFLEGFVPVDREQKILNFLNQNSVTYFKSSVTPKDVPPILLKNNKFSQLFEPITKLFSLPSYQGMDLTPFFAPFFMLFFGLCLGDVIYGVLIVTAAIIMQFLPRFSKIKPLLKLGVFLGIATILAGLLGGTFGGISHTQLSLGNFHNLFLSQDQFFSLALALGIIQILFGLLIQAWSKYRQFGLLYSFGPVGWILLIVGIIDSQVLHYFSNYSPYVSYVGLLGIVFFSSFEGNWLSRIGKGLWELYGITGLFGDVLSYIRLFALGVSSAILGMVVNSIALSILDGPPVLGHVFFIVFLLIGHGLNIFVATLGAFVHPLRLTFVEFYKNAGFQGGGKPYTPFQSSKINTKTNQ